MSRLSDVIPGAVFGFGIIMISLALAMHLSIGTSWWLFAKAGLMMFAMAIGLFATVALTAWILRV
jgi:hypothetical protein